MPKLNLNNVIGILIVAAIFGSVIYVYFIKEEFDFDKNGVQNIGVVVNAQQNSTTAPKIRHNVNGEDYIGTFVAQLPGLTVGEKFPLLYNPDNPKDVYVRRWQPLFLSDEVTGKITGEITYITEVGFGVKQPGVSFEFIDSGNGQRIERSQKIPLDYKTQFPNLSVGQRYEVEYWQENPKRAIIYLDRPVRE